MDSAVATAPSERIVMGAIGLDLRQSQNGPCFIKNTTVIGGAM